MQWLRNGDATFCTTEQNGFIAAVAAIQSSESTPHSKTCGRTVLNFALAFWSAAVLRRFHMDS
jgi:hypothetical protein